MILTWQQIMIDKSSDDPQGLFMTIAPFTTISWGVVYGFNDDPRYGTNTPTGRYGELTTYLYRDIRVPTAPKVVRIANIGFQQERYVTFATEIVDTPITPSMPDLTWKLEINNTVYDFSQSPPAAFRAPVSGRYISVTAGSVPWNASTVGTRVPFKFV